MVPLRITRRDLLRLAGAFTGAYVLGACMTSRKPAGRFIQTVRGAIAPEDLGPTLIHEHVMVDFVGADKTGPERWDRDEVVAVMQPYLEQIVAQGITGFGDCSPAYLGRDPLVLARLSELTGLHIVTNTGLYKEPYVPQWAMGLTPEELAARWIGEWRDGIEGTDVRPGFIKIAVHPGPLPPLQQTIVRAAALTHLATGLTVASHTGHYQAAMESLDLAEVVGMNPSRYIIVHAQNIAGEAQQLTLAERGAWLEYDGIGPQSMAQHLRWVTLMLERGYEDRVLISHDAGWYAVGEARGGQVTPYTTLMETFVPLLRERGADEAIIQKLLVSNPARALAVEGK